MKKKILFFVACVSLISVNLILMNMAHAYEEEEIMEGEPQTYFNAETGEATMTDGSFNNATSDSPTFVNGQNQNGINDQLDGTDNSMIQPLEENALGNGNSDSEMVSGSAPIYQ